MKVSQVFGIAFAASLVSAAVNLQKKNNIVVYWGQNSRGLDSSQPRLREFCDNDDIDIIPVSFITKVWPDKLPETNFANACEDRYPDHPQVLHCPQIGEDIKYCQSKGKLVLLSIGGATYGYDIPVAKDGVQIADWVWDMYMGGDGSLTGLRPFGKDVIPDGIDLDLESWGTTGYVEFSNRMREHYEEFYKRPDCKRLWISAAPQCFFPDGATSRTLENAYIDMVFIQFYNNECGVKNFVPGKGVDQQPKFNYPVWDNYSRGRKTGSYWTNVMKSRDARLFLGTLGGPHAKEAEFASPKLLREIISAIKDIESFSGIMMWDAAIANDYKPPGYSNKNMLQVMREVLNEETLGMMEQEYQGKFDSSLQQRIAAFEETGHQCRPTFTSAPPLNPTTTKSSKPPPPPTTTTTKQQPPPPPPPAKSTTTTEQPPPPPPPTTTTTTKQQPAPQPTTTTTKQPAPPPPPSSCKHPKNGPCDVPADQWLCAGHYLVRCVHSKWTYEPCSSDKLVCKSGHCNWKNPAGADLGENPECDPDIPQT